VDAVRDDRAAGDGRTAAASPPAETPVLAVRGLRTTFSTRRGEIRAVDGLDFEIGHGERVGIVGESGSGKSVTAYSILGLLRDARIEGRIEFDGRNLLDASARELRAIRGARIALIFQDPLSSLNPVMKIGDQITEPLRVRGVSRREARRRAVELLERVGLANAGRRLDDYPHQFSGGMRQRVMIAIALVTDPDLIIADEPTTALDVRVQAQVLDLLQELADERRVAVLLITHDLGIVAGFADRVIVMYAGRAVETGTTAKLFGRATHPYTLGLLGSLPRIEGPLLPRLAAIGGHPPSPARIPPGCPFHPRCAYAQDVCRVEVPGLVVHPPDDHPSACHFAGTFAAAALAPTHEGSRP
jgi:oligopeptide/dipeptide ABC transporter ATP-binding protein